MTRPRIVFLDRDSLPVPLPAFRFPCHYCEYPQTDAAQLVSRLLDVQIVVTNKVALDRASIYALPQLRLVAVAATGVNHVDLAACRERGIAVCNVRHYGDDAVAEHAFMLLLALMHNLPAYQRDVAAGLWGQAPGFCLFGAPIRDLRGRRLGIVGSGGIGQALASRARAFGMEVYFAERRDVRVPRAGFLPFSELLASSDVLSLHCPLTDETRGMIGERELQAMKPGAVLVNTARGGLVDEMALVAALKYGQLGGAGFDVLSEEPPRQGNPLLKARLPNLIVTPHVAWASDRAMHDLAEQLVGNIEAFVAGSPRHCVN